MYICVSFWQILVSDAWTTASLKFTSPTVHLCDKVAGHPAASVALRRMLAGWPPPLGMGPWQSWAKGVGQKYLEKTGIAHDSIFSYLFRRTRLASRGLVGIGYFMSRKILRSILLARLRLKCRKGWTSLDHRTGASPTCHWIQWTQLLTSCMKSWHAAPFKQRIGVPKHQSFLPVN